MFPMTITVHNEAQLATIMVALDARLQIQDASAAPSPSPAPSPTPSPAPAPTTAQAPTPAAPPITYDRVSRAITAAAKADRAATVAVLGEFGVERGTGLKPEQYAPFLDRLEARVAVPA